MATTHVRNRTGLLGLALTVLAAGATGCDLPLFHASSTESAVFETGATPKIVVETFNGAIDISNGMDDEVVAEVTKRASGFDEQSAENNLDAIEVTMDQQGDEIRISVRRHGRTLGDAGASVVIAAPKGSQVELKSSNGHIVSEGMEGTLAARTSNGKIDVVEAHGTIDVHSTNGAVNIEAQDATVDARTSNGRIRFVGTLSDAEHEFTSSNGRIDLALPADAEFRFDAATSNGRIDIEFPYSSAGLKKSRRKKAGTVGEDPKCSIEIDTSNSSINIHKDD